MQLDASAARDIEARLRSYGFDQHAIGMEVYVQAREIFTLLESLLNGAKLRRLMLLREINNIRHSRMADLANIAGSQKQRRDTTFARTGLSDEALIGPSFDR